MYLSDASTSHVFAHTVAPPYQSRYSPKTFYGIALDTCCAHASTSNIEKYNAYCKYVEHEHKINDNKVKNVKFGIGETKALGISKCSFPIENNWFRIDVYIVDADVPIPLSLSDMDRLNIYYDNTINVLTHKMSKTREAVSRKFGHPFLLESRSLKCLFTRRELH